MVTIYFRKINCKDSLWVDIYFVLFPSFLSVMVLHNLPEKEWTDGIICVNEWNCTSLTSSLALNIIDEISYGYAIHHTGLWRSSCTFLFDLGERSSMTSPPIWQKWCGKWICRHWWHHRATYNTCWWRHQAIENDRMCALPLINILDSHLESKIIRLDSH